MAVLCLMAARALAARAMRAAAPARQVAGAALMLARE